MNIAGSFKLKIFGKMARPMMTLPSFKLNFPDLEARSVWIRGYNVASPTPEMVPLPAGPRG